MIGRRPMFRGGLKVGCQWVWITGGAAAGLTAAGRPAAVASLAGRRRAGNGRRQRGCRGLPGGARAAGRGLPAIASGKGGRRTDRAAGRPSLPHAGGGGAGGGKARAGRARAARGKGRGLCRAVARGCTWEKKSPARGGACKGGRTAGLHAGGGGGGDGQRLEVITPSIGSCKR
jgi:hypothetical protein